MVSVSGRPNPRRDVGHAPQRARRGAGYCELRQERFIVLLACLWLPLSQRGRRAFYGRAGALVRSPKWVPPWAASADPVGSCGWLGCRRCRPSPCWLCAKRQGRCRPRCHLPVSGSGTEHARTALYGPSEKPVPDMSLVSWGIAGFSRLAPCQPSTGELASRRRHYLRTGIAPVVTAPRAVFGRQHLPTGKRASPNPILSDFPTQPEALGQSRAGVQPTPPHPVGGAGRSAGNGAPSPARVGVPYPPACHRARRHQVRCTPPLRFGPSGDDACARRPSGGVGTGNAVLPFGRSSGPRRVEQGTGRPDGRVLTY